MNEDKILQMFFDIGQWTKAIEKGVLKDIRKADAFDSPNI